MADLFYKLIFYRVYDSCIILHNLLIQLHMSLA